MSPFAVKAADLDPESRDAWLAGKAPRRLLAIPFSGPIGGRDQDLEWFSARTDIKPSWFEARPVLWHHGRDRSMGLGVLGKATDLGSKDGQEEPDDEGWWVDVWLQAGARNTARIEALAKRGAELFGSSATFPHMVKRSGKGEILVWPYIEQTLTTAPSNTHSTFLAGKAAMDDFNEADIAVPDALRDVLTALEPLRDLPDLGTGPGDAAKAGRRLSRATVDELDEWIAALSGVTDRARSFIEQVRAVYQAEAPAED